MADMYDRHLYLVGTADGSGNDPLSDNLLNKWSRIPASTTYVIPKHNEFRSDKIAAKFLADSNLFWVILEYNKLLSNNQLKVGSTINIPDIRYLNDLLVSTTKVVSTKTIYIK